jgi:hypothetical protein
LSGEDEEEEEEEDWWLQDQVATSSHLVKTIMSIALLVFLIKEMLYFNEILMKWELSAFFDCFFCCY